MITETDRKLTTEPGHKSIDGIEENRMTPLWQAPFLIDTPVNEQTIQAVQDHISCRSRTAPNESHEKTNPYKSASHSTFHVTFFQLLQATGDLGKFRASKQGTWNHGPVYGKKDKLLCESALTVRTWRF